MDGSLVVENFDQAVVFVSYGRVINVDESIGAAG